MRQIVIKSPIITEKSLRDVKNGIFTFAVDKKSNKIEIGREIENLFKVHVKAITTEIIKGKKKFLGRKRQVALLPDTKKARVKLAKGEKIGLFEVGGS